MGRTVTVSIDGEDEVVVIDGKTGPLWARMDGSVRFGGDGNGKLLNGPPLHDQWRTMGITNRKHFIIATAKRQKALRERTGVSVEDTVNHIKSQHHQYHSWYWQNYA